MCECRWGNGRIRGTTTHRVRNGDSWWLDVSEMLIVQATIFSLRHERIEFEWLEFGVHPHHDEAICTLCSSSFMMFLKHPRCGRVRVRLCIISYLRLERRHREVSSQYVDEYSWRGVNDISEYGALKISRTTVVSDVPARDVRVHVAGQVQTRRGNMTPPDTQIGHSVHASDRPADTSQSSDDSKNDGLRTETLMLSALAGWPSGEVESDVDGQTRQQLWRCPRRTIGALGIDLRMWRRERSWSVDRSTNTFKATPHDVSSIRRTATTPMTGHRNFRRQ